MIKITNGKITIEVTKGAYDSFFAKQGFKVLNNDNEEWEENENGEKITDKTACIQSSHLISRYSPGCRY